MAASARRLIAAIAVVVAAQGIRNNFTATPIAILGLVVAVSVFCFAFSMIGSRQPARARSAA
ncbi:MAG TPA: hypothetical protein VL284_11315 [Thermoanaerobaculia bacterium]|nr:hypothetical protein [Thermoanaerobaculia bacterium]